MIETSEWLLLRTHSGRNSTLGNLFRWSKAFGWVFQCFILEDEKRLTLVHGETRIPEGRYEVKFRTQGEMHLNYSKKFPRPEWHKGMLELQNVPGRQFILIHIGNTPTDTQGCLLTGFGAQVNSDHNSTITESRLAYEYIYPKFRDDIIKGPTFIRVSDINGDNALAVDSPGFI